MGCRRSMAVLWLQAIVTAVYVMCCCSAAADARAGAQTKAVLLVVADDLGEQHWVRARRAAPTEDDESMENLKTVSLLWTQCRVQ